MGGECFSGKNNTLGLSPYSFGVWRSLILPSEAFHSSPRSQQSVYKQKSSLFKWGLSSTRLNHRTNSFTCLPKYAGGWSEQFKLSVAAFNKQASRRLTKLTGLLDE